MPTLVESLIRARLPVFRLLQAYLPLAVLRWLIMRAVRFARLPADVEREPVSADGVCCEWLIPHGSPGGRGLLYLHGGGFVLGVTHEHLKMVAYLAQTMGIRALMVDYRLGPEHPFPAALDDCLTAYRWLLKQGIAPENVVVAGDSAGGNLAIVMMMKLRDSGERLPAAAACLSPPADLSDTRPPATFRDPLLHPRATRMYDRAYVADHDPRDPLISPVFGDWHGLPPLLVHAGEDEMLRDDATRIGDLAREAGVDVRVKIFPRMWHVWQLSVALPEARRSLGDVARFLGAHLPPGVG